MSTLLCSRIQTQRDLQHHTPLVRFFIFFAKGIYCLNVVQVDLHLLSFYFQIYITYLSCYLLHFLFICCVADKVFAPTCLTQKVYEEGAKDVALSALSGISCNSFSTNCYCIRISLSLLDYGLLQIHSTISFFSLFAATIFAYGQTSSGKTFTMRGITESAIKVLLKTSTSTLRMCVTSLLLIPTKLDVNYLPLSRKQKAIHELNPSSIYQV